MVDSASRSSSCVVMPGRTCLAKAASVTATTRPALRIMASSPAD